MGMNAKGKEQRTTHRLGEYLLGPRLRGLAALGLGRIYRAWHCRTGRPALLAVPTHREPEAVPPASLALHVLTSHQPPYLAVEVDAAGLPSSTVLEEVLVMAGDARELLEETLSLPGTVEHLTSAARPQRPLLPRWVDWGQLAAVTAALALALWPSVALGPWAPPSGLPPASAADLTLTDMADADALLTSGVRVPDTPLEGQKRPPCEVPEVRINGGCWLKLDASAPCPKRSAEHRGGCYVPVAGKTTPVGTWR